jgi:NADPH:quinone reductase-like Zn-dependent oxidoreductase
MKAAVRLMYGLPEVISVKEVERPVPRKGEVLVKVYAATVNRSDYHVLTGKPFIMKLSAGLLKPKLTITGSDFAGKIERIGENVSRFKIGDKVMGFIDMGAQSHAEYLAIAEDKVTAAPSNLSYEQVAACLEGAFYALCAIQLLKPKAGQKALVYGATGAIGSSYVQFFKYYGVYVTAVCGGENRELIKSLGANKIVDYKTEDFAKDSERYDFVCDAVGKCSFAQCKHLLVERGIYTSSAPNLLQLLVSSFSGKKKEILAVPKNLIKNLEVIKNLAEAGHFKPVIDRKYPLEKIKEAYAYVASGQKIGNVIITINDL